jgi:hypothetical protein
MIQRVPEEAIKSCDEENALYNIKNNSEGSFRNYSCLYHCTFNLIDKLLVIYGVTNVCCKASGKRLSC